eukprot:TRINITY_DN11864_c0_g1_i6.p2 TRINITY_DN11864_c0_g1~~TRINITY_DN11864_c0_g1_i6.p2  ORF type:complete len:140 (+),score=43.86 TRINITY_DN11864_c0_g1_i6:884-1303(+)
MGGVGVSTLLNKLMILLDPSIWVDQKYILETFSNLSKNGVMVSFLSTPKLKDVLLPFLTCDVEPLRSTTKIIFDKLRLQNVSMMASSMAPPLFDEECLPSFLCPITQGFDSFSLLLSYLSPLFLYKNKCNLEYGAKKRE